MSIFQKSVLRNTKQNEALVAQRWTKYQKYLEKIDFIEDVKEEKYQEGFLRDIFESCLGYTLDSSNPSEFNLEREKKNETDTKKADGVIYVDGEVIGVIELKGQDTKNLDKVETQAFGYLVSHSLAKYVIISNFDELRFYIDKKTAYEEFSLFTLDYNKFKKLHLLLSYESIKEGLPLKLKEKSASFEEEISKNLYRDFSLFRTDLYENLIKNNELDQALLLRLTQKLCDRIIFILFAEDRGFLTPNTIREIREEFVSQKFTNYSLYDIYKFYFNAINEGNEKLNISKYNGGLFAKDSILDNLIIDDNILDLKAQALSDYDFMSDVSVNILGHIFEKSLTDLEEMNASINKIDFDNTKSKRKKDGVFYTPEYITEYIVDNTLGKLCREKKENLGISELTSPKNPKKPTIKEREIKENLNIYREWLLNLKILDPACGSGAFLNQALEFLIREHISLQKDLVVMGDIMAYYEVEKSILENNLYGVDINEDAVEIAKLSLWLRTATKGRELTTLGDKIKCGNSLIDDKSVADNAFVWEDEFAEVFEDGGFDIVIGNPPYVSSRNLIQEDKTYFEKKYKTAKSQYDLYTLFIELGIILTKNNRYFGYILPDKFLITDYGKHTRELLINNADLFAFKDLSNKNIFEDASVYPVIIILEKLAVSNSLSADNIDFLDFFGFKKQDTVIDKIESIINKVDLDVWRPIATSRNIISDERNIIVSNSEVNRFYISENRKGKLDKYREKDIAKDKILIKKLCFNLEASLDEKGYMPINTTYCIKSENVNLKYILCCINSSLLSKYARTKYKQTALRGGYIELRVNQVKNLPIKKVSKEEEQPFIEKANIMLELNKKLHESKQNFINELALEKVSKKIYDFEDLSFEEFIKEYKKIKKLKFIDKLEERNFKDMWSSLFENDRKIVLDLKLQIRETDRDINNMVYTLYGFNKDEIKIIENS